MSWLNVLIVRLRALFWRDQVLHEIDEELRAHLEMETEANREMGMTPEQARRSAAKSFGNVGSIRDLAYEVKGGGFMETVWQDLRYSARMLFKHPRLHDCRCADAQSWYRREHCDLQYRERGSAAAISISGARTTRHRW